MGMTTTPRQPLTADTITDEDIVALLDEADAENDTFMCAIAQRSIPAWAVGGGPGRSAFEECTTEQQAKLLSLTLGQTRQLCADAINAASAQADA